jgi:hypothetical protein
MFGRPRAPRSPEEGLAGGGIAAVAVGGVLAMRADLALRDPLEPHASRALDATIASAATAAARSRRASFL